MTAPTWVQQKIASGNDVASLTATLDAASTSGHLLVLWVEHDHAESVTVSEIGWHHEVIEESTEDSPTSGQFLEGFWKRSAGDTSVTANFVGVVGGLADATGERNMTLIEYDLANPALYAAPSIRSEPTFGGANPGFLKFPAIAYPGEPCVIACGAALNSGPQGADTLGFSASDILASAATNRNAAGSGDAFKVIGAGDLLLDTTAGSSAVQPTDPYIVLTFTDTAPGVAAGMVFVAGAPADADPAAGVFIDWQGNGFEPATEDEISGDPQNVISWVIRRGAAAEITGSAEPGSATLILKNPDDLYNPRNIDSPLYGIMRDGNPVWIGPNSDGALTGADPRGLFGGRITDITPIPAGGATDPPTVEIVCEDMLSWARRTPVQLDYAEGRSHQALRQAALDAAGETRYSLAHEIHTMPLSHADGNLAQVLDDINAVNGTRHLAKPENLYTDWFTYTTRNRFWRLDGTTSDAALDAATDHVTSTDGWRLSADTVINRQKATVTPIRFTPGTFTVWQADSLPIGLTPEHPFSRIVDFDDVVRDPVLNLSSTGDTVIATFTPFATAAKIELSVAAGDAATIDHLSVEGRLARRLPDESYTADDTTSQAAPRGIREGGEIGNEYLGVIASARGIALHAVLRYGNPQLRPTLTVENWLPDQFELDLYDVIAFTSPQLKMDAHLFEIVGLTHEGRWAASAAAHHHLTTYVLQESALQSAADWFILDDDPGSLLDDGESLLAY